MSGFFSDEILSKIINKIKYNNKDSFIIAIDGMCGSGKSTLTSEIYDKLNHEDVRLIHADDFFLPFEMKTKERLQIPGGNIHYERFKEEVINHLNDKELEYGIYNCCQRKIIKKVNATFKKITIIEGSYCMNDYFGKYFDLGIFLKCDEQTQFTRLKNRIYSNTNIPDDRKNDMLNKFKSTWIPLENFYFKECNIEMKCELIFNTD